MSETTNLEIAEIPSLARLYVQLDRSTIAALVRTVSREWELAPELPTFSSLQSALQARLSRIARIANQLAMSGASQIDPTAEETRFLYLDPLSAVSFGVEQFNTSAEQPYRKWALLFDELEIAPPAIRQALLKALRSTNSNLLFKLSLSPYHQDADLLNTAISAMPAQGLSTD